MVAGNWKMNTTVTEGIELLTDVLQQVDGSAAEVVVLPPFTHLVPFAEQLSLGTVILGAQNCYREMSGAYTGEVSPRVLRDLCSVVLLGHSERRHILGESDELVAAKMTAARAVGLRVILAVGETLEERDAGSTTVVIERQLLSALERCDDLGGGALIVAYEPVWAIGTGQSATSAQAEEVCGRIADQLTASIDDARAVPILYGGSVTVANAAELFAQEHIDGALVGGASLKPDEFSGIVRAAGQRLRAGSG